MQRAKPSRARRTASRTTARLAWRAPIADPCLRAAATGRAGGRCRRHGSPMSRASRRSASGSARCQSRRVKSTQLGIVGLSSAVRPSARAPCRRSGSGLGRPGRSPDASGRCRACLAAAASPRPLGQIALRVGREFGAAAGRTEPIESRPHARSSAPRADIDLHPAYGVGGHMRGASGYLGCVVVHRGWALPRRELDSVIDLAAVAPRING